MSTKIISLNLSNLKNKSHWDFNDMVVKAIAEYGIAEGEYAKFITPYMVAFRHEDDVYQKYDRLAMTQGINTAESLRDRSFRLMYDLIKFYLAAPETEKRDAAGTLMGVVHLYGGSEIPTMAWSEQSGAMGNIYQDFTTKYASQVEQLGLSDVVAHMGQTNDDFLQQLSIRAEADADLGKEAVANARIVTDSMYRGMINVFNAAMNIGETELVPFAKYLNARIPYYRTQAGQGQVTTKPDGEGGEVTNPGEGEGDVTEKPQRQVTLTFEDADHKKYTRKGRPGDKYRVPTGLKTGEIWVNSFGQVGMATGVYPDTDMEFFAMPDSLPKVTYHFIDGDHLTFTGEPDAPYIIPVCSPGYVWMPEPNGLIPAQSQQYFEVFGSNSGGSGSEGEGGEGGEEGGEGNNPGGGTGGSGTGGSSNFDPSQFTPGMAWPSDKPAPEGCTKVDFEYYTGQTTTKLYRQGATIISQGNMPEPTEGYTWVGIYMILSTPTYTVTEEEE